MAEARIAARLILLLSLAGLVALSNPALAAPEDVKWSRVNIPTEGKPGGWTLAKDSDVKHLTMSAGGTLYAYANPPGTSYTLFKSTDEGYSWSHTGGVEDEIVAMATDPDDDDIIYYATKSDVYKSSDAGESFIQLPPSPGGAGNNNVEITALDTALSDEHRVVIVGTEDTDNSEYGGIYLFEEAEELFPSWINVEIGSYDVYSVAFSPYFADDAIITAVATDETHTYVAYNYGTTGDWNTIELLDSSDHSFAITEASNIALTPDFCEPFPLFVGVVGGDGGIYEVDENHTQRLNSIDSDIISLDLVDTAGTLKLMAGENDKAEVWYSDDGGDSWELTTKAPTGSGATYVLMAPDFASSGQAYAATSGSESAVSYTSDNGTTWNQIGLIDTAVSTIIDLALSPNYDQDATLFLLTWGGEHSLWRSLDGAGRWERVLSSVHPNVDSLSLVSLPPHYDNESRVVFLAGARNGSPVIWKSSDNGQSFSYRGTAPLQIDTWAVADDSTLFIGGYDGLNGLVYLTTNGGRSYSDATSVGSEPLYSIVLSPDYESDKTVLAGNTSGWVYWSSDNGGSFEPLPVDATSPPLTGSLTVTFDPDFDSNRTVYAASDTPGEGIHRFTIGRSTDWKAIDTPAGGMFQQVAVSDNGTLYATNFKADGGLERSLNPTYSLGPTFETVTRGLDDGATLTKLWLQDERLWSIDTTNVKLMTLTDTLTVPVTLTSPTNQAQGVGFIVNDAIKNVELDWTTLSGATEYEWQLDDDTDFSTVLLESENKASSEQLPDLEPATTYYWRVRASEPVLSPWSEKWSFTTAMGSEATGPELINPEAGATGIPVKPLFQWSALAGATGYELIVSSRASLDNPAVLKIEDYALADTAWECEVNLDYGTTYYWKVRAVSAETHSDWSAAGVFTTQPKPPPTEESLPPPENSPSPAAPQPPPQETSSATTNTPDWVKYLIGALLAAVVVLAITVLVLLRSIRRPHP